VSIKSWSTVAGDNVNANTGIDMDEGMDPAVLNNSIRAVMAAVKEVYDLTDAGTVSNGTVGGTASAITLTCSPTVAALASGQRYLFPLGSGITGATTLNVDGLGALAVQWRGAALASGDYNSADQLLVSHNGTNFQILSPPPRTMVTTGASQTLTNKTISGGTFSGSTTIPGSGVLDSNGRLALSSNVQGQAFLSVGQNAASQSSIVATNAAAVPANAVVLDLQFSGGSPDNNSSAWLKAQDTTTTRIFIYSDGDVVNHDGTYGTISTLKFKPEDKRAPASDQWEDVKALAAAMINYETQFAPGKRLLGWGAEDVLAISPGVVHPIVWKTGETLRTVDHPEDAELPAEERRQIEVADSIMEDALFIDDMTLLKKGFRALGTALETIEQQAAQIAALQGQVSALAAKLP
jgi:hypothetical protein